MLALESFPVLFKKSVGDICYKLESRSSLKYLLELPRVCTIWCPSQFQDVARSKTGERGSETRLSRNSPLYKERDIKTIFPIIIIIKHLIKSVQVQCNGQNCQIINICSQGLSSVKVERTKRSPAASGGVIRPASLTVEVFLAVSLYFISFNIGKPARTIAVSLTLFKRGWAKSSQLHCEIFQRFNYFCKFVNAYKDLLAT